jgi:hypothetical protein
MTSSSFNFTALRRSVANSNRMIVVVGGAAVISMIGWGFGDGGPVQIEPVVPADLAPVLIFVSAIVIFAGAAYFLGQGEAWTAPEHPRFEPDMDSTRDQLWAWLHERKLPTRRPSDPQIRAVFESALGPPSSMDNVLSDDGGGGVERFAALLVASGSSSGSEFEGLARIAVARPFVLDWKRVAKVVDAEALGVLSDKVEKHAYWSTVAVALVARARRTRSRRRRPSPLTSLHVAFLRDIRPELWAALSSAGAPTCTLDGAGILAHHQAEFFAGSRILEPCVDAAVCALVGLVDHEGL